MKKPGFHFLGAVGLLLAMGQADAAAPGCDRSCLIRQLDGYLKATVAHKPDGLALAAGFRETQNSVDAKPGTGIWTTAQTLGSGVRYADPVAGEAGYFGIVEEAAGPAIVGLRIKVQSGAISEAEWIIARKGMALYKPEGVVANPPRTARPAGVAAEDRATAIAIANSYFEGIDESSGPLVKEHPECYRIENGTHMVGRKPSEPPHTAQRPAGDGLTSAQTAGINSCTNEFDQVGKRTDDVIDRRFFYDPEAGLVWGHGIFSRIAGSKNPQGEPWKWLNFMELFQIDNGKIRGIHAAMDYLPAGITSSGWGGADE